MLGDDIHHLMTTVAFFRDRRLHSEQFLDLVVERLGALADRARALEATVVPEAARRVPEETDTVVRLDDARRRLGR